MQFTRTFFASLLAVIVAFLIVIPILFFVVGGVVSSFSKSEEVAVASGTVLHMKLNNEIVENAGNDPFEFDIPELAPFTGSGKKMGLYQIINGIKAAKDDERVKGIYLNLQGGVGTGWANLSSIREALLDFKSSGKFIYAYSEAYGENAYYLASTADSVFLPPQGIIEFNGLVSNRYFLKGTLEKLDVKPRIFKVGTYKSAVEPFIRDDMSEANKEQTRTYLGTLWNVFAEEVAASRNMSLGQVNDLAENFMVGDGLRTLQAGLIDGMHYESEVWDMIKAKEGLEEDDKLPLLKFSKYLKADKNKEGLSENKIAVIFAEGGISSGKSSDGTIGSETIVKALRKAAKDENVKGVVLRINSPGGSALASDIMAEEIRRTRKKKPVFASMGDVAASGGYYIAAPCDSIYARPNTITGSIGIFSLQYATQDLFKENLGVTFDAVETHTHANFLNPNFPMDQVEEQVMQTYIERGYGNFIEVVRKGRSFPDSASVDAIGQGRVWSGRDAMERGLVDRMGDLEDVITAVATQAGVEGDYQIMALPKPKNQFEELLGGMANSSLERALAGAGLAKEWKMVKEIKQTIPEPGIYMMLPYKEYIH